MINSIEGRLLDRLDAVIGAVPQGHGGQIDQIVRGSIVFRESYDRTKYEKL
jgi:hypothetical protein